jgi:hypothetical protein
VRILTGIEQVKFCRFVFSFFPVLFLFVSATSFVNAQSDSLSKDKIVMDSLSNTIQRDEKVKKGLNFGGFPIIGYDSDLGFRYGVTCSLYDYGDGKIYPDYRYNLYFEINISTKGYWNNEIFFDSKKLLPWDIRLTADVAYLMEKTSEFYGFNGYNSFYNSNFIDKKSDDYITRVFYRYKRNLLRTTFDFQRKIKTEKIKWVFGLGYYGIECGRVDVDKYNKGRDEDRKIHDTTTLYDNYVNWGAIPEDEVTGGSTFYTKFGFIFDTRDNEPNPWKGLWTELSVLYAPPVFGIKKTYAQLHFIHRQYFTLVKKYLSLAYRVGYQTEIAGEMPFYMQPFIFNSFYTQDGLGGSKNLRGVKRNRVIGKGLGYANLELRYRFVRFSLLKQNFYLALSAFGDAGIVAEKYKINIDNMSSEQLNFLDHDAESVHIGYGAGLHLVMNSNFIVTINFGLPADPRDGDNGLYLGVNFLF